MNKTSIAIAFSFFAIAFIVSCNKEEENETNISSYNKDDSHNMGQNCMDCHKSGGQGEGWFNAAGTVYNNTFASTLPGATVRLYTGPGGTGTLKYTIQVDKKGNFYTTEAIDFGTGLYPSVQGSTSTQFMSSAITTGQCNSCHGVSTNKIWAE